MQQDTVKNLEDIYSLIEQIIEDINDNYDYCVDEGPSARIDMNLYANELNQGLKTLRRDYPSEVRVKA